MSQLPTVCVIGAGSSGIAATKAVDERLRFDCYEKGDVEHALPLLRGTRSVQGPARTGRGHRELRYGHRGRGDVERERAKMFKRYVASKRHTMQVDFDNHLHELGNELRAGGERARRHGFSLPVRARAREAVAA